MEAIGSSFFLMLLLLGIILLIKKKKTTGIILIVISLFFLFILPANTFNNYKKETNGSYRSDSGEEVIIENGTYKIIIGEKTISKGTVEYSNIDDYSFYLNPDQNYESDGPNQIRKGLRSDRMSNITQNIKSYKVVYLAVLDVSVTHLELWINRDF